MSYGYQHEIIGYFDLNGDVLCKDCAQGMLSSCTPIYEGTDQSLVCFNCDEYITTEKDDYEECNDHILAQQELEDFEGYEPEGSAASEVY